MKVFKTQKKLRTYFKEFYSENTTIGFVPTMGALHKGHVSLIEESQRNNDITIASIFVNPTQFNKKEDLENYPRTIKSDLNLLEKVHCDVVFIPSVSEIYTNNISASHFNFDGLETLMEGKYREGHFNGVGTIVKKLFEIIPYLISNHCKFRSIKSISPYKYCTYRIFKKFKIQNCTTDQINFTVRYCEIIRRLAHRLQS